MITDAKLAALAVNVNAGNWAVVAPDGRMWSLNDYGALMQSVKGEVELEILYRFFNLSSVARVQALHLTSTRSDFVLREYVDQQEFARCANLDEVEKAIEKRKADMSARTVRLRELATGHTREGEHRGGWRDWAAWARLER